VPTVSILHLLCAIDLCRQFEFAGDVAQDRARATLDGEGDAAEVQPVAVVGHGVEVEEACGAGDGVANG